MAARLESIIPHPGGGPRRGRGGTCWRLLTAPAPVLRPPRPPSPSLPLAEARESLIFGTRAPGPPLGLSLDPHNSAVGQRPPARGFSLVPPETREGPAWPPSEALPGHAASSGSPGTSGGARRALLPNPAGAARRWRGSVREPERRVAGRWVCFQPPRPRSPSGRAACPVINKAQTDRLLISRSR